MSAQEQQTYLSKPRLVQAANNRIADRADRLQFLARIPMLCECEDPDCSDLIPLNREEYLRVRSNPSHFLTRPSHQLTGAQPVAKDERYWVQRRNLARLS